MKGKSFWTGEERLAHEATGEVMGVQRFSSHGRIPHGLGHTIGTQTAVLWWAGWKQVGSESAPIRLGELGRSPQETHNTLKWRWGEAEDLANLSPNSKPPTKSEKGEVPGVVDDCNPKTGETKTRGS
jgi:hypothetical protein